MAVEMEIRKSQASGGKKQWDVTQLLWFPATTQCSCLAKVEGPSTAPGIEYMSSEQWEDLTLQDTRYLLPRLYVTGNY